MKVLTGLRTQLTDAQGLPGAFNSAYVVALSSLWPGLLQKSENRFGGAR